MVEPNVDTEPVPEPGAVSDALAEGVSKIQLGFAESAAEHKYGGYGSTANVQRSKHAVQNVAALQQEVLLQELKSRTLTGPNWKDEFGSVINKVMSATDPLMGRDAEHTLLNQQQPYQVVPVPVTHEVPATATVGGRSLPASRRSETFNIPIER